MSHCLANKSAYNWSNLDVGNYLLDHSEGFFKQQHTKHAPKEDSLSDLAAICLQPRLLQHYEQQYHLMLLKEAQKKPQSLQELEPRVYRFKDIYEQNKQRMQQQCLEQERKQREFHSRPMPNFQLLHSRGLQKQVVHRITCPKTPNVLKNSYETQKKREQKVAELLRQRELEELQQRLLKPKARAIPKACSVQHLPQLLPKSPRPQLEIKPFQFSTELRAQQRKLFDIRALLGQEQRRKQLEQQRKQRELEHIQKQRQLATFRAKPNPFSFARFVPVSPKVAQKLN